MQSTAIGDSRLEYWETILLLREVLAALMSDSRSFRSTPRPTWLSRNSTARWEACGGSWVRAIRLALLLAPK